MNIGRATFGGNILSCPCRSEPKLTLRDHQSFLTACFGSEPQPPTKKATNFSKAALFAVNEEPLNRVPF